MIPRLYVPDSNRVKEVTLKDYFIDADKGNLSFSSPKKEAKLKESQQKEDACKQEQSAEQKVLAAIAAQRNKTK